MRIFWLAVLAVAACDKRAAPRQEATSNKSAADPWNVAGGSAGAAEDTPAWANDPPNVLRDKINGVNAHVIVLKSPGSFTEYRDVLTLVEGTTGVVAAEPFIFLEAMIAKTGKAPVSILLKAVDPGRVRRVLTIGRHMKTGTLESLDGGEPPSLVLGDELARTLDVKIGDQVTITPVEDPLLPTPSVAPKVFRVTGTFHMAFDEYDERLGLASLDAVQAMQRRGDQVMGIEMRVKDLDTSDEIASAIEKALGGPPYRAMDWYELNKELFTALYGERRP